MEVIIVVVPNAVLVRIIGLRRRAVLAVLPVAVLPVAILPVTMLLVRLLVGESPLFVLVVRVHGAVTVPVAFLQVFIFKAQIPEFWRRFRDPEFLKNAMGMLMRTRTRGIVHKLSREITVSSKAMDHSQSCNCKKSHHQRNYYTAYWGSHGCSHRHLMRWNR